MCQEFQSQLENWLQNIDLQTEEAAETWESPLDSVPTVQFKPLNLVSV